MHEPGDQIIVADNGLAVAPGLHTLFDVGYTIVSNKKHFDSQCFSTNLSKIVYSLIIEIIGLKLIVVGRVGNVKICIAVMIRVLM